MFCTGTSCETESTYLVTLCAFILVFLEGLFQNLLYQSSCLKRNCSLKYVNYCLFHENRCFLADLLRIYLWADS